MLPPPELRCVRLFRRGDMMAEAASTQPNVVVGRCWVSCVPDTTKVQSIALSILGTSVDALFQAVMSLVRISGGACSGTGPPLLEKKQRWAGSSRMTENMRCEACIDSSSSLSPRPRGLATFLATIFAHGNNCRTASTGFLHSYDGRPDGLGCDGACMQWPSYWILSVASLSRRSAPGMTITLPRLFRFCGTANAGIKDLIPSY
jgi:hypothetical protein